MNENGNPAWLKDGSFLWFSERSGFKHLYHYKTDGTLVRQVTTGRWDVRALYGVDESNRRGLLSRRASAARSTRTFTASGSTAAGLTRLSQPLGTHRAIFNPSFTQYVGIWSDVTTPPQVRLHRADGAEVRVIDANPVQTHGAVPAVEARVRAGDGARRLRDGRDDHQAARLRPVATLSRVPAHLRRAGRRAGAQPVGRARPTCFTSCSRSTA